MPVVTSPRTWTRETRLLVLTVVISGAVLSALAQFRFPEQRRAETIAQPLEQIAARVTYDELAAIVGRLHSRVAPSIVVLRAAHHGEDRPRALRDVATAPTIDAPLFVPALRIRPDIVIARLTADLHVEAVVGDDGAVPIVLSTDPLRGVALVRVPAPPEGTAWQWQASAGVATPSYVAAVEGTRGGVTLRPLFLGRSDRFQEPRWATPLLALGAVAVAAEGAFVVALDGTVLGMATEAGGSIAVIPTDALTAAADALLGGQAPPVDFGLTLQPMSAAILRAVGSGGVIVAAVAPGSPADGLLRPGDVIAAIDGEPVAAPDVALVRLARTAAGRAVHFTVRREGATLDVDATTTPAAGLPAGGSTGDWPGLTLARNAPARVDAVEPGSAAALAGLRPGDVVVQLGPLARPAAREAMTRLAAVPAGGRLIVAVERDGTPLVVALERP